MHVLRQGSSRPSSLSLLFLISVWDFPHSSVGKESACNAEDPGSIPGSGRVPEEGKWQPTPGFLPGESHGQRSLSGYGPWVARVGTQLSD